MHSHRGRNHRKMYVSSFGWGSGGTFSFLTLVTFKSQDEIPNIINKSFIMF